MLASKISNYHDQVSIPAYPSCEGCLTWSEEGLAVATGANVRLLSDHLQSSPARPQRDKSWSTTILRVDQFSQTEWPEQYPTPIDCLSVAEEQSDSVIVSICWSPPGLGIHRRCVLAVLTSNLLLSIWETNGAQRSWRRTCIVNNQLREDLSADVTNKVSDRARKSLRIRAFIWLQPLHVPKQTTKWGEQYLAVVDDNHNLVLLSISKRARDEYGNWLVTSVCKTSLPPPSPHLGNGRLSTKLSQKITQQPPVKHIQSRHWSVVTGSNISDSHALRATTSILYQRHHQIGWTQCLVEVSVIANTIAVTFLPQPSPDESTQNTPTIIHDLSQQPEWKTALGKITGEYDRKNQLSGLVRVRFWGFSMSPDTEIEAACVSMHPWDTYEYTSPVHEKAHILFRRVGAFAGTSSLETKGESETLGRVLDFIIVHMNSIHLEASGIDRMLLKAFRAWSLLTLMQDSKVKVLDEKMRQASASSDEARISNGAVQAPAAQTLGNVTMTELANDRETCEICSAEVIFTTDISTATCQAGHAFTRCSLSLLPIQEPGISKYCSRCDRQFLNLIKLGPHSGQELIMKLFDEFDLCPYCEGKYCS